MPRLITEHRNPKPGDGELRVRHYPRVTGSPFEVQVDTIEEGRLVLDLLAEYDLFEVANRVKPDYSNMGMLLRYVWDDDEWEDVDSDE